MEELEQEKEQQLKVLGKEEAGGLGLRQRHMLLIHLFYRSKIIS